MIQYLIELCRVAERSGCDTSKLSQCLLSSGVKPSADRNTAIQHEAQSFLREPQRFWRASIASAPAICIAMKMVAMICPVIINYRGKGQTQAGVDATQQRALGVVPVVDNGLATTGAGPAHTHEIESIAERVIAEAVSIADTTTTVRAGSQDCFQRQSEAVHVRHKLR